jgi:hypothetical protein
MTRTIKPNTIAVHNGFRAVTRRIGDVFPHFDDAGDALGDDLALFELDDAGEPTGEYWLSFEAFEGAVDDLDAAVADEIEAAGAGVWANGIPLIDTPANRATLGIGPDDGFGTPTLGDAVAAQRERMTRKDSEMTTTVQTPSGVIKVPARMTATETDRIRREWENRNTGPAIEPPTALEKWSIVFVLILAALFIGAAFLPAAEGEVPAPPFVFELPDFVSWEGKPWAEVFGDGWRLMAATSKTGSLTFLLEAPEGTPAYLEDPVSTKLAPGLNSVPGGRAERRALTALRAAGETRRVLWFYIDGRRFGIDVPLEMWVGDVLWSEVKFSKPPAPSWAGEVCRSRSYVSTLANTTVIRTEWRCR